MTSTIKTSVQKLDFIAKAAEHIKSNKRLGLHLDKRKKDVQTQYENFTRIMYFVERSVYHIVKGFASIIREDARNLLALFTELIPNKIRSELAVARETGKLLPYIQELQTIFEDNNQYDQRNLLIPCFVAERQEQDQTEVQDEISVFLRVADFSEPSTVQTRSRTGGVTQDEHPYTTLKSMVIYLMNEYGRAGISIYNHNPSSFISMMKPEKNEGNKHFLERLRRRHKTINAFKGKEVIERNCVAAHFTLTAPQMERLVFQISLRHMEKEHISTYEQLQEVLNTNVGTMQFRDEEPKEDPEQKEYRINPVCKTCGNRHREGECFYDPKSKNYKGEEATKAYFERKEKRKAEREADGGQKKKFQRQKAGLSLNTFREG